MSNVQLAQRLISMEAGINSQKLRNGQLTKEEWERFHNAIVKMAETPIYIDDTPAINIFELRAKCRRLKQHHGVELIIVDYLQLMTAGSDNKKNGTREQEISSISRALKGLAKELEVPVIALAQLSRAVEGRKNNIPMLSDLRESGSIEQDADIVSFIYRPGYYLEMNSEEYREVQDKAEIIIAKHRNGALDTVELKFVSDYARFENPNDSDFMGRSLESLLSADRGLGDDYITRPSRMNDEDVPY
jgi:replicative DNA helicase